MVNSRVCPCSRAERPTNDTTAKASDGKRTVHDWPSPGLQPRWIARPPYFEVRTRTAADWLAAQGQQQGPGRRPGRQLLVFSPPDGSSVRAAPLTSADCYRAEGAGRGPPRGGGRGRREVRGLRHGPGRGRLGSRRGRPRAGRPHGGAARPPRATTAFSSGGTPPSGGSIRALRLSRILPDGSMLITLTMTCSPSLSSSRTSLTR